jgi:hypothetical protein
VQAQQANKDLSEKTKIFERKEKEKRFLREKILSAKADEYNK